ncbi:hypothetical protein A3J56_01040 [Candidatus Giovannonibacteria bacterium RIFCSPHIGHO2_02_FULL_46_20]|uniref:MgtC/SapB/SrpB/YhiD N-terminal domain-containing protein n=1 Tax=Candidatus Giovannonibacteria bacterium RIFCSPHIGHO2_02_FULL_46_20 TaxID=1798338 RepID=A0A1F5WFX6_9BACT|nr:MAG: hypothetical protein A3J56_01040 [Candidatus Giovannonibacteria bacterium RIFCSPHIGHO2_02_FULL_46_20]
MTSYFSPETIGMFFQLLLATLLGMTLGFERQRRGKPAGLRTYTLVCLGSALFTILSSHVPAQNSVALDPSRIASQVVVGIGFIGAGIIFLKEDSVFGLTTAAGLWVAAAIGMAVGFQMYPIAIGATVISFLVLWLFTFVDNRISRSDPRH